MRNLILATTLVLTVGVGLASAQDDTKGGVSVPDGGTTLTLMTGALLGIGALRNKLRR